MDELPSASLHRTADTSELENTSAKDVIDTLMKEYFKPNRWDRVLDSVQRLEDMVKVLNRAKMQGKLHEQSARNKLRHMKSLLGEGQTTLHKKEAAVEQTEENIVQLKGEWESVNKENMGLMTASRECNHQANNINRQLSASLVEVAPRMAQLSARKSELRSSLETMLESPAANNDESVVGGGDTSQLTEAELPAAAARDLLRRFIASRAATRAGTANRNNSTVTTVALDLETPQQYLDNESERALSTSTVPRLSLTNNTQSVSDDDRMDDSVSDLDSDTMMEQ